MNKNERREINEMTVGQLLALEDLQNYVCDCQTECNCESGHLLGADGKTILRPWMATEALRTICRELYNRGYNRQ